MNDVNILQESIMSDWRVLCEDIGERLAGTDQERRAAQYIMEKFRKTGCAHCHLETFPCRSRQGAAAGVQVNFGGGWRDVETAAVTGSSSTDGVVEGDAVWFEMPENAPKLKPGLLKGKIAVLFGPLPEIVEHHRKLVEAAPLAVVHVDHRLPFSWAKNDGTYPLWVTRYGFPATVTVPFNEAWHWRQKGKIRLRVRSEMNMVDSSSDNVVAELPGTDPDLGILLLGAHHDSQAGNVGADDNASGVVCLLELARLLKGLHHKRTIRFISFGTEEQLSVGSAYYVKQHRKELDGIDLMINFDSVASPLGHHEMFCTGGSDLADYAARYLARQKLFVAVKREAVPFADHFPFSVFEVPALWFFRENFPGGRWQHHSVHDNLQNVSIHIIKELISAVYRLIAELVQNEKLPFGRELDPDLREQTLAYAKTLYDLSG
jgi:aminopeptidase YwaD